MGFSAYNEEKKIGNLISDLANQDLFSNQHISIEIHVVANGCTDDTAGVAHAALDAGAFQRSNIKTFVHNLARAGKSNAWNEFVHTYALPETQFSFLLDADIRIPEPTTLRLMLDALIKSKTACVAIDDSVKDLSEQAHKTLIERLILAASGTAYNTRVAICGQLYCVRHQTLKDIWMPVGLPGEDGFLRAMILTKNFTEDETLDRLIFVEGARHIFESERTIRSAFRHNVRLAIGTAINMLLFNHFRESESILKDVGGYIRSRNATDPNWVNELIAAEIRRKKYFLLNKDFVLKRLQRLSSLPISQRFRRWPVFMLGIIFDMALIVRASQLMRRGAGAGFW